MNRVHFSLKWEDNILKYFYRYFTLIQIPYKLEKVLCTNHSKKCDSINCSVKLVNRYTQLLNIGCDLGQRKQKNIRLGFVMHYRFNNVYRQFLINLDMDFCAYMAEKPERNLFLESIMPHVTRFSNINHPCPYSANVSVRNMPVTNVIFNRAIIPSGQYRLDVNIYDSADKTPIIFCKVFLTVPNSNDANLDTAMG